MSQVRFSGLMDAAVTALLDEFTSPRRIPAQLARQWPGAPPLEIVLAMVSAADAVEAVITNGRSSSRAQQVWRYAALLATDLYAMERLDLPRRTGADLLSYWHTHDQFFLGNDAGKYPDD